ncbi:MAG: hypothetical protein NC392_15950, partial [Roseburia sp.]|nr:hypothetical protein [Roseburia sp.]
MNAVSGFMYAVLLLNLSGVMSYLLWRRLYPYMEKNASSLVYLLLRQTCVMGLLPLGYVIVRLVRRNGYIQGDDWWRMAFRVTGTVGAVFLLLWLVWGIRTACAVFRVLKKQRSKKKKRAVSFPEKEGAALEEFRAVKKKMRIRGFVGLYRAKGIRSPKTTGALFARVFLPYLYGYEYTEEQLDVIYSHELTHYKSGDAAYKLCSLLAGLYWIFRFTVFARERDEMLTEWSERSCDIGAIKALRGRMTGKDYFRVILEMIDQQKAVFGENGAAAAGLVDGSLRLERRMEYVRRYEETMRTPKSIRALFAASFMTANLATACLAGFVLADVNDMLYRMTEHVSVEAVQDDLEMKALSGRDDDTYVRMETAKDEPGLRILQEGEKVRESWTVTPGVRYISGRLSLKQGRRVKIFCTTVSDTETVWVGLMKEDNKDIQYIEEKGNFSYLFTVLQDGEYHVFVQNSGSSDIEVRLIYQ